MPAMKAIGGKTDWVVVADEAGAIVYARDTRIAPLRQLFTLSNPEARRKTGDKISDRGGRSFDSRGAGRHTLQKEKPGSERQDSIRFAKTIAETVNRAIRDGSCRRFVLISAPRFLGFLRQSLKTEGAPEPELTIDKDLVGQDSDAVQRLLERQA